MRPQPSFWNNTWKSPKTINEVIKHFTNCFIDDFFIQICIIFLCRTQLPVTLKKIKYETMNECSHEDDLWPFYETEYQGNYLEQ